jgi:hypothetical protein
MSAIVVLGVTIGVGSLVFSAIWHYLKARRPS